jgi:trigger factor
MGEDGVLFTVKVTVMPEAAVSDYKGIEAVKGTTSVSDKEVDDDIERLRDRNSRTVTVEGRAAKDGDIAVIDFEGFVDDVAFDGGKGENYSLTLGSGSFIPGFEDQIVGKNAGEEFDVNVTFPEEYTPELAGKAAVFKVKLHEIKAKELPELDDEFVKDVSEYDTLDELKKSIREEMAEHKAEHVQKDFEQAVIASFLDKVEVEIPDVMVTKRAEENIKDYENQIKASGFDLKMYLQLTGGDMESFTARMHEEARKQVKLGLGLEKVAELEKLEVSEEDYEQEYKKIAEMYSMDIEQVKAVITTEALKPDILNKKAWDFLIANAVALEEKAEKKAEAKPKAVPKAKAAAKKKTEKEDKKED